jgi:hydroxymethylpyrimidine/phosphomethylpyrimidine kinase
MDSDNSDVFPVVLTIASSDNSGGAGVQMDLYSFSMLKLHATSVITGITAQNSYEFVGYGPVSDDLIEAQLETLVSDFEIKAIKTGMLTKPDIVRHVADLIKDFHLTDALVVDPVLGTTVSGELDNKEDLLIQLKTDLIPLASIITPNLPEAFLLLDKPPEGVADIALEPMLSELKQLGPKNVLLKGGHVVDPGKKTVTDLFLDDADKLHRFEAELIESGPVHGTGCMLSALITGHLGMGFTMYQSVAGAESLLHECLKHTELIGNGDLRYFNTSDCGSWQMHQARVYDSLQEAAGEFVEILTSDLVPEVGINFGYALPAARSTDEICALDSRIIKSGDGIRSAGGLAFGASSHVARIILAAMAADLRYRSALNLCYRKELLDAAEKAGFSVGTFNRDDEPEGQGTMEWGTAHAIERLGKMPDVIYDLGGVGKEPMIRVIARDPGEIVSKVRKLKDALK